MSGFRLGAAALALVLCVGCGPSKKSTPGAVNDGGADGDAAGAPGDSAAGAFSGDGGSGGALGGSGASAGTSGATSNGGVGGALPPDGVVPPAVTLGKLDLLLMVDNSIGMGEKQRLLADAVSWLLNGAALGVSDVHIGVITSSLGSHGANGMRDVCVAAEDNDHARLIGSLRPGLTTYENKGFLAWGPDADPKVETVLAELVPMIAAIGEVGCGYEASLESWYRFLVDPEPPLNIVLAPGSTLAEPQGLDNTLLGQRKDFLRADSVLAIVTLSDENDCSIQDLGYGWLTARTMPMFRATSQCLANPNDKCCQSCGEPVAHDGCPAVQADAECVKGMTYSSGMGDDLNLRCFQQKRRFGFDLLYPISRYQEALTRQFTRDRAGSAVPNPLFAGQKRHPSQVIYTGIVGVPWQDLADAASLTGAGLTYLTATELTAKGHWQAMLGDPDASPPVRGTDPFMLETPFDRGALSSLGANPFVKAMVVPSTSTNPQENPINGHELVNVGDRQLQPACTFPRATPKVCDQAVFDSNGSCRCFKEDAVYNDPTCQPPGGGAASTTQYAEVAYPGTRHLQLQRALGDQAVTASACAKVTTKDAVDYGYRPAMKALAARLQKAFKP